MTAASLDPDRAPSSPLGRRVCKLGRIHDREAVAHSGDGFFPVAAVAPGERFPGPGSRTIRQRFSRRHAVDAQVWETTCALNAMAGYSTPKVPTVEQLPELSQLVRRRVLEAVQEARPPQTCIDAREACSVLLGHSAGPYQDAPGPASSFARSSIAWPSVGSSPGALADRVPSSIAELLEGRCGGLVRTTAEFRRIRARDGLPNMHGDHALENNRAEYVWFIKEGLRRGLFTLGRRAKEHARCFFVPKKTGTLRIIIDCRRANQRFHVPPGVSLFFCTQLRRAKCKLRG